MKARLLTTLATLLLALTSWANGVKIDGIYYDLNNSTNTATVSRNPNTAYTGNITIPASVSYGGTIYSVTSIGYVAFSGCTGLTSITIPASVTSLGSQVFYDCTGLTSISIPASVTSIGTEAFSTCSGLASIKVEAGNTAYDSRENCNAIIETASNALVTGCMNTTIPSSVTSIGSYAFRGCTGLASISIPASVTSIEDFAFYGCTSLASISIPASVTTIGGSAFYGCTGLTSITIPASVTSIGWDALWGCSSLTDIYARHTDPKAYHCLDNAFSDVPFSTCTLHVPIGSKEAYANTAPWSKFKNIVEAAAQTARHPVQSRRHGPQGARKVGHDAQKTHS